MTKYRKERKKERKSEVTWHAEFAVVTAVKRLLLVRMKFWQVSSRDKPAQLLKQYFESGLEIVSFRLLNFFLVFVRVTLCD